LGCFRSCRDASGRLRPKSAGGGGVGHALGGGPSGGAPRPSSASTHVSRLMRPNSGSAKQKMSENWEIEDDRALAKRRHRGHDQKVAYVSMRQHTSAYVSIRQHTFHDRALAKRRHRGHDQKVAYVSIRQHTSAYVSIRQHTFHDRALAKRRHRGHDQKVVTYIDR
jgi:hypothetical protein